MVYKKQAGLQPNATAFPPKLAPLPTAACAQAAPSP
jgi:hypothetical protein